MAWLSAPIQDAPHTASSSSKALSTLIPIAGGARMGAAVCCDRCGKFEKYPLAHDWQILDSEGPKISDPAGIGKGILLCVECKLEFEKWMVKTNGPSSSQPVNASANLQDQFE